MEDADVEFFWHVLRNENHVLHPLLPDRNEHGYELRHRPHERVLTSIDDKRNLVYRQYYINIASNFFSPSHFISIVSSLLFNCVLTVHNKQAV